MLRKFCKKIFIVEAFLQVAAFAVDCAVYSVTIHGVFGFSDSKQSQYCIFSLYPLLSSIGTMLEIILCLFQSVT